MIPDTLVSSFASSPITEDIFIVKGSMFSKILQFQGCNGEGIEVPTTISVTCEVTNDSGVILFSIPGNWLNNEEGRLELFMDASETEALPNVLPVVARKTFIRVGRFYVKLVDTINTSRDLIFLIGDCHVAQVVQVTP